MSDEIETPPESTPEPHGSAAELRVEGLSVKALFDCALGLSVGTPRKLYVPQTEVLVSASSEQIARRTVEPGEYVIGHDPSCDIVVEAEGVGERHALLTVNYDELFIEDLGSGSGTAINDRSVTEATKLWPNQKVQLGSAILQAHRIKRAPAEDETLAPSMAAVRECLPPEFFGEARYEIGGVVAQGGMGAILDARDSAVRRTVAMKVMLNSGEREDLLRFVGEAQVTGQLEHPSIVPIYEIGVDAHEQPFYTMKYVRGVTLRAVLEKLREGDAETVRRCPLATLLTIFQKVCDGIAFAHAKGVIHRDLKPENIMIGEFGEVLVMDWGLAKVIAPRGECSTSNAQPPTLNAEIAVSASVVSSRTEDSGGTVAATVMGTPQFMAPEQAAGEIDKLDARSDIFSLGGILYNVLTLRPPVSGDSIDEIFEKLRTGEIASPLSFNLPSAKCLPHLPGGRVPESLSAVAMKALALRPEDRYASVPALQKEITAYQGGFATAAERAGFFKQLRLLIGRHKALVASIGASLLLIVAISTAFMIKVLASEKRAVTNERRAVANEERVTEALGKLRGTAPTFQAQATALIEGRNFAEALEKISYAIVLRPDEADYHYIKGNILESLLRIAEARDAYMEALRCNGAHLFARQNFELCETILKAEGDRKKLSTPSIAQLQMLMREQGRLSETVAMLGALGENRNALYQTWKPVFEKMVLIVQAPAVREGGAGRAVQDEDGLFRVSFFQVRVSDLSPLAGAPIKELELNSTQVIDLSPLQTMPLRKLKLAGTAVQDLSQLKGLQLRHLDLLQTKVRDIGPLQGMPLEFLNLNGTAVADLRPVAGMRGLKTLCLEKAPVTDISPLRGMPLKELDLGYCMQLRDISALADSQDLERLILPYPAKKIEFFRQLPKLARLSYQPRNATTFVDRPDSWDSTLTAAEFWRQYEGNEKTYEAWNAILQKLGVSREALKIGDDGSLDLRLDGVSKDLGPLRGMPLRKLSLLGARISDIGRLTGLPLQELNLSGTDVRDLTPLRGMPLEMLSLGYHSDSRPMKVSDISPLRDLPLKRLTLDGTQVTDLSPLADCRQLEKLVLPAHLKGKDLEVLRRHPSLQYLSWGWPGDWDKLTPAAEFWKEYDAKKAKAP